MLASVEKRYAGGEVEERYNARAQKRRHRGASRRGVRARKSA